MNETEQKSYPVKWVAVGIVLGIVIIGSFFLLSGPLTKLLNPPRPEITYKNGHDGFQGLNYVMYVDVTVRNNGGNGWIVVYSDLDVGGRYEKQDERIYLNNGETKDLTFTFDVTFLGTLFNLGNAEYRVWAVAD